MTIFRPRRQDHSTGIIDVRGVTKTFHLHTRQKLIREHLTDRFRRREPGHRLYALKNISFRIEPRESVAIVGSNGAGKSTLLSLLAGVAEPDAGRIEVHGRVTTLLELGSGFHPDLSGEENIFLNAALLGLSEKKTREVFPQIVDFSEIGHFISQPVRTYSTGMILRLAFSVAVNADPEILLIDEVLAVGDAQFTGKCFQKIQDLLALGVTLLCVSHSSAAVFALCRRAIWLDHGEIVQDGEVHEVVEAYLNSSAPARLPV
jgi:ABC-type polysaccharide/polyol phosphate transport system ATPase subunit